MTYEQVLILAILAATVAMFLWGRWRHDMVAAGALLACVAAGLVSSREAFAGFSHPAVITVAWRRRSTKANGRAWPAQS